jgi:hypothetical protein
MARSVVPALENVDSMFDEMALQVDVKVSIAFLMGRLTRQISLYFCAPGLGRAFEK